MPSARRVQWAKFRVAATIFSALLILGVFLALLTGGTLMQQKDALRVYMPDAAGLGENAPVRLNGMPIGKITSIRLSNSPDPNRGVEVRFQIDHRYLNQLASDSLATTTTEDIQGDKYLDITRGHSPVAVRAGGEVRFQPAPDVLKTLDLAQFETQLRAIDALMADIQAGKGALGELLRKDDIYQDVLARLGDLRQAMHAATSTQEALGELLYRDTLYQDIVAPVRELDRKLAAFQKSDILARSDKYDELRKQAAEWRRRLADLNAGAGGAGQFLKRDDLYTAWTRTVANAIASVDSLNAGEGVAGQWLTRPDQYESLNGSLRELQRNLADFRNNPKKYLRLGIF